MSEIALNVLDIMSQWKDGKDKTRKFFDNLDGLIPECLGSFVNLTTLYLCFYNFIESIPSQLFSLRNLQTMDLSYNQLTGFNPFQSLYLSNLRTMNLSNNQLTRFLPSQLFSLTSLQDLDLSFNHLSGEIPQNLSRNLVRLIMENNRLTGEIPEALGNMSQLHWLGLSNKKLTRQIPISLNKISYLDLSNNELLYTHSHNTAIGTSCNITTGRSRITTIGKTHSTILMKVLGALGVVSILIMCYMVLGVVKKILHNREEFK